MRATHLERRRQELPRHEARSATGPTRGRGSRASRAAPSRRSRLATAGVAARGHAIAPHARTDSHGMARALDRGQHARRRPAEHADRRHADHDHAGIDVLLRDVEHAAEPAERADQLGRDQRRPDACSDRRRPVKIIGAAAGHQHLARRSASAACPACAPPRSDAARSLRTPVKVLITEGTKAANKITMILAASPRPSHRMASGIQASGGIGRISRKTGLISASARRLQPISRPERDAQCHGHQQSP